MKNVSTNFIIRSFLLLALFVQAITNSLYSREKFFKKKKVAVCYFGLTRSLKYTYQSHIKYILNVYKDVNIDCDIFMHTWSLKGKQRIWTDEVDVPIDYDDYRLLNPHFFRRDDQDAFTENLDMSKYFYQDVWEEKGHHADGEWLFNLVLNHLCALESQKRVTDMVLATNNRYDYILYVRPDVEFKSPINVSQMLQLTNEEILLPIGHDYEGYNDRFAILTFASAPIYGKRIDHIADFRRNHGRIVSEKYLKYIIDTNHLKVCRMQLEFDIVRPSF